MTVSTVNFGTTVPEEVWHAGGCGPQTRRMSDWFATPEHLRPGLSRRSSLQRSRASAFILATQFAYVSASAGGASESRAMTGASESAASAEKRIFLMTVPFLSVGSGTGTIATGGPRPGAAQRREIVGLLRQ